MTPVSRQWLVDLLIVFLLAACLVFPLFQTEYLDKWGAIQSTFIADARMLADELKLHGWQPYWYCGTRVDYVYPPGLRFGTVAIAAATGVSIPQAYNAFIALLFCMGIAFVYWLARVGSGLRSVGWLSAASVALLSPALLLFKEFRDDTLRNHFAPMRLHVLIEYGEGPHMSSLAVLGGFLAAAWLGLQKGHTGFLLLASILAALVTSLNFYGATAMAILFPLLVFALWVTHRDHAIVLRAIAIGSLAWGLSAFWLTPAYVRVTLENMKLVAQPGNTWSMVLAVFLALVFLLLSLRYCYGRTAYAWPLFLISATGAFLLNVAGNKWFGFRVIGEPHRLIPELDLVLLLALVYLLVQVWRTAPELAARWNSVSVPAIHTTCGIVLGLMLAAGLPFLTHNWKLFPADPHPERRLEYQISSWLADNLPKARLHVVGSTRLWYNVWHSLPQVSGGSDQGLANQKLVPSWWDLRMGQDGRLSTLWLQATAADAVVVSDETSREQFKDILHPRKFDEILPVIYDNHAGDRILRVPRRYPERARVVNLAAMLALKPYDPNIPLESLAPYVALVEEGPDRRVITERHSPEKLSLRATIEAGDALLVQESYDPAWRARIGSEFIPVEADPVLGFLFLQPPIGEHEVVLEFTTPAGNRLGWWLTVFTLTGMALWLGFHAYNNRRQATGKGRAMVQ